MTHPISTGSALKAAWIFLASNKKAVMLVAIALFFLPEFFSGWLEAQTAQSTVADIADQLTREEVPAIPVLTNSLAEFGITLSLSSVLKLILGLWGSFAICRLVTKQSELTDKSEDSPISTSLRVDLPRGILISLIAILLIGMGHLFMFLPGLILTVLFLMLAPIIVAERPKIGATIRSALFLEYCPTKEHKWASFFSMAGLVALYFLAEMAFEQLGEKLSWADLNLAVTPGWWFQPLSPGSLLHPAKILSMLLEAGGVAMASYFVYGGASYIYLANKFHQSQIASTLEEGLQEPNPS